MLLLDCERPEESRYSYLTDCSSFIRKGKLKGKYRDNYERGSAAKRESDCIWKAGA